MIREDGWVSKKSFLSKRGIEAYITIPCAVAACTLLWHLSHVLTNGFRCLSRLYEFYAMLCIEVHFIKTSTTTGSNYYSRILKVDAYKSETGK